MCSDTTVAKGSGMVHPRVLEQAAEAWANKPKRPLDRTLRLGLNLQAAADAAELTYPGRKLMYRQAREAVLARTHGHYPAPLKALVYQDAAGKVWLAYNDPASLARRHGLGSDVEPAVKAMSAALAALAAAATAP